MKALAVLIGGVFLGAAALQAQQRVDLPKPVRVEPAPMPALPPA